jgi:hypothetical protein
VLVADTCRRISQFDYDNKLSGYVHQNPGEPAHASSRMMGYPGMDVFLIFPSGSDAAAVVQCAEWTGGGGSQAIYDSLYTVMRHETVRFTGSRVAGSGQKPVCRGAGVPHAAAVGVTHRIPVVPESGLCHNSPHRQRRVSSSDDGTNVHSSHEGIKLLSATDVAASAASFSAAGQIRLEAGFDDFYVK